MVNSIRNLVRFQAIAAIAALALSTVGMQSQTGPDPLWPHPVPDAEIVRPYQAPLHEYGAGHRGVDYKAELGTPIKTPADARVYFSGSVAGRQVLTLAVAERWLISFEPVSEPLAIGSVVSAGDIVAVVGTDERDAASNSHHPENTLHIGVRLDGEYINPELLFKSRVFPILLPCCEGD